MFNTFVHSESGGVLTKGTQHGLLTKGTQHGVLTKGTQQLSICGTSVCVRTRVYKDV